jgi:hypothetical protein
MNAHLELEARRFGKQKWRWILLASAIFLVIGCSRSGTAPLAKDPLVFESPAGWKTEYKTSGGLDFYTLTAGKPDEGLLMFSQWPPPNKPEEIPRLVQQTAETFLEQARKSSQVSLASQEYHVEQFSGAECQGSYVVFRPGGAGVDAVQVIFMMSVDGKIWNGQFGGPSNEWTQAIAVLKGIRKVPIE